MIEIGSVFQGKYQILAQIGKGGMSTVFLALDQHLNKQWAVKEIRKQVSGSDAELYRNSLNAEANLMKGLDHPALPRIVDITDDGETICIVMDYIEGRSLDKVLKEKGPQSEEDVLAWGKQLCDALGYLHNQNPTIIYRDMKPANVMLKPDGTVKLIDFGTAREYKQGNLEDTTRLGTQGYAAPEQYGGHQTDVRSDIYTLGMTLYHLITGIDPKRKDFVYQPIRQVNHELSDGLELIIDKCIRMDPKDRYQTCGDLMYDLEHPDLITKGYKHIQKRRLVLFSIVTILAMVFLAGGIGCRVAATKMNSGTYEALTSVVASTSLEEKIDSYKQAIELYPYEIKAYNCIIEAYENEGHFSKSESDKLLALYNANKEGFDTTSVELANLNYRIGMMYFNYYTDEDGTVSFSNRIQKAYPFFATNVENTNLPSDFKEKDICQSYYDICTFYRTYVLSSVNVEEASRKDYENLFKTIENGLENIKDAGAYDQLTFYNGAFLLLYDQRTNMYSVNVSKNSIDSLMQKIDDLAASISVQKEQSKNLQSEIVDNYSSYSDAINRIYENPEREGDK